jgi:hypothetical protein
MPRIDSNQRFQPKTTQVAASIIDGETVIVHLSNGNYYSMDATGSSVWALIEQRRAVGEIAEILAAQYGVDSIQVSGDLQPLMEKLLDEEIIEDSEAPAEMPAPPAIANGHSYIAPKLNVYRDMRDLLALDPPMPGLRDIPWKNPDQKS